MTNKEIIDGLNSLYSCLLDELNYWSGLHRQDMVYFTEGRISMCKEIIEGIQDDDKSK